jgi:hypothetical protein
MANDLRAILRAGESRQEGPTACILDLRMVQSTPESGHNLQVSVT